MSSDGDRLDGHGATLGQVLDDLGSTVLDVVYGRIDPRRRVNVAVIVDPFDPPAITPHAIVLGVGVGGSEAILELIDVLAEHQTVGLVLREPVDFDAAVAKAATDSGVLVFGLMRGVAWNQVAATLANTLTKFAVESDATPGAYPAEANDGRDLTDLADAISALLDAPITIEDLNSRILAFSSDQDRADQARKSTVLGQHVPDSYLENLRSLGVFKQVYASDHPVYLPLEGLSDLPRVVMRVSAHDEVLGSIWAVVTEPLSPQRQRDLADAAKLVALQLLRGRNAMDSHRRSRQAMLVALLAGGDQARSAAGRLSIDTLPVCVIAVTMLADDSEYSVHSANDASRLMRLANALALQLTAAHPGSIAGVIGDSVYGVLPVRADLKDVSAFLSQVGQEFHDRSARREPVLVAIGSLVHDFSNLSLSRRDADRAMRVIRSPGTALGRTVVRADEVQIDTALFEVYDRIVREQTAMTGPVPDLLTYDRTHDTDFMQTLDAFLESFGDIVQTAARLHVHPNTCRYRLRRITEICGLDLNDPDARFNAMLQLRVLRLQ